MKYNFVNESRKLLEKLPSSMRFVGKPELLSDTFLESKLDSIVTESSDNASLTSNLTSKDLH